MELHLNDRVELKKQHPCGCKTFVITRVGMDITWRCEDLPLLSVYLDVGVIPFSAKAEKSIRKILSGGDAS